MKKTKKTKKPKSLLLPLAAGIMVVLALIVVLFFPKGADRGNSTAAETERRTENDAAELRTDGSLMIHADRLSTDKISFIRISENSRIELLARLGDDGTVKAALGTCQSCNGSPGAYYTQKGDELKCNNCGLTFPISVLDSPGGGCHPIMLDSKIVRHEGNDLVIDMNGLLAYEGLFSKVADH